MPRNATKVTPPPVRQRHGMLSGPALAAVLLAVPCLLASPDVRASAMTDGTAAPNPPLSESVTPAIVHAAAETLRRACESMQLEPVTATEPPAVAILHEDSGACGFLRTDGIDFGYFAGVGGFVIDAIARGLYAVVLADHASPPPTGSL